MNKGLKGCLFVFFGALALLFIVAIYETRPGAEKKNLTGQDSVTARKEYISNAFSSDGSHRKLVSYVKERMNDQNSFEHVKTVYWDFKKKIVVQMTYRGKNGFGALVIQTVIADTDLEGNILDVKNI